MNRKDLYQSMNQIDDDILERSEVRKKRKSSVWMKWGAMAACALAIVGIGVPHILNYNDGATSGQLESDGKVTSNEETKNEAGEGENNLVTMTHMAEIKIKIDEMFPDGFRGTIEVGTDVFKVGEQITIVVQDNVTVVQKDGSIFDYDELEPNIKESDLAVGKSVWVGFQKYDYVEGNGKYNQIFAYHVDERDDSTVTDIEPMEELTLEEAVADERFGNLFPASILDGYVLQDTVAVLSDTVLVASFYNEALEDELTIRIAVQEWFYNQHKDLKLNMVMYREKNSGTTSYIYIAGGDNIVQYSFTKTDIADNEKFYDMVYSASYFSECIDYPDIDVNE